MASLEKNRNRARKSYPTQASFEKILAAQQHDIGNSAVAKRSSSSSDTAAALAENVEDAQRQHIEVTQTVEVV